MPSGALAANLLGLSTQVPAKMVYLSDGPTRTVKVGNQTIYFKHAQPKETRIEGPASRLVIQALRYLGRDAVGDVVIQQLRRLLPPRDQQRLLREARYSADWIYQAAQRLANDHEVNDGDVTGAPRRADHGVKDGCLARRRGPVDAVSAVVDDATKQLARSAKE